MKKLLMLPFVLLAQIFGNVSWIAPPWLSAINGSRQNRPFVFYGWIGLLIAFTAAYLYYGTLPKPITVMAEIQPLSITDNSDSATPDTLNIAFNFDVSNLSDTQPHPEGVPSVARIDLVGKDITRGISLSPSLKGTWSWINDRQLQFVPENDWPAGVEVNVSFDASIFSPETQLTTDTYPFQTPAFGMSFTNIEFYQDPTDISVRRVVSTLSFTHPVDTTSFEEKLSMGMRPSGTGVTQQPTAYQYNVTYDKNHREAYIQSVPVALPDQPNFMSIKVASGVTSILGGESSEDAVEEKVLIPDLYSFLKVSTAKTQIVRNANNEPEQMLMLEFTDDISEQALLDKLSLVLLPKHNPAKDKRYWSSPREVTAAVISKSEKVALRLIPNERDASKVYTFAFDLPVGRYLYLKLAPGLTSVNKFVHASFYDTLVNTPSYPKGIDIAGEGSVLTYSGDHKLSVLSRGVSAMQFSVGRLLDHQIAHLVSQTNGDITNPRFTSWQFNAKNLSEFGSDIVRIQSRHPREANYSSLDLSRYLQKGNSPQKDNSQFGLFFVEIKEWDLQRKRTVYGATDSRLILVTDLGVIVKNNAHNGTNSSHDVFVQSIASGKPVDNATVELLGKNGIALYSRTTTSDGHVQFPSTRDFKNEKQPTVYVVKSQGDISFIPFNRRSRQINLSKFDIGGVSARNNRNYSGTKYDQGLNAFLFSDRGIYRPGEKVNIGLIVKNQNLSNVENIPLEVVIRGPRNNEVSVKRQKLLKNGFFDIQYPTDTTSDTGKYNVSLHLVRDNRYRGREIGSTSFKVEEFQPDTIKIESKLENTPKKGWYNNKSVTAKISLQNLFGIPAQDRKVSGHVIIRPTSFSFKDYASYTFSSPFSNNQTALSTNEPLESQKTDADGFARFDIDLQRYQEGTYRLKFITEGFDQAGGRSVTAINTALISPLDTLVGFKADGKLNYINANSKRAIEFIVINKALKQIEQAELTFKLLEIQPISTLIKQSNGTYKYQTVKREKELSRSAFSIAEAGHQYAIDTALPGDFAIELMDANNRRVSRVEYSVVGHGNMAGKLDKNAELQLKLNKADYVAGELIEMNIKAPYSGAGLITIETDKVHHFKWFSTDSDSTLQTIRIPDTLEGTGYMNVAFVRDVSSKEIFASPLSYAVQPFTIDKSKRKIDVELEVNDIVRPGKLMEISYTASRKSRIALFAIDEGILQVAKYKTPDPLGHFLQKRSLDVETLQILDLILPDFDLVKELSASGGGEPNKKALGKNLNPFARKLDKPAVYWSGIHDAGPESRMVRFDVPNTFAGELRVMAVAVGEDAMGAAHDSTIVRGPFVLSPNVLTQAAPGDEFMVTVGVANIIEGSGKAADVALSIESSKHLSIVNDAESSSTATLAIDEGGEGQLTFKVKVNEILGAAELRFTATHKKESTTRTTSLSVRPAMPYYTSVDSGFEKSGTVKQTSDRRLYANLAVQSIAASASPLVLVDGLTSYLKSFPHGCTEQVVSKVFPLIGLATHPAFGPHQTNVQSHFSHVITKLRERQLGDGGFSFWPGQHSSAEYPSIYVMHFLIEARDTGFPVPKDMMQRGQAYLTDYVGRRSEKLSDARDRANAIYLLTRLGVVTTNYLVDLQEYLEKGYKENSNKDWRKDLLASYMAATYALLQKENEANRLIAGYEIGAENQHQFDDFHSPLAQDAQHLYLLSKHFEGQARSLPGDNVLAITERIFKGEYNTISSAYSILALGAYSKLVLEKPLNENIVFAAQLSESAQPDSQLSKSQQGKNIDLKASATPFLTAKYKTDVEAVSVKGQSPLFFLNVQSGFDKDLPQQPVRNNIEIIREFLDEDGTEITELEQGKEITVRLKVRALGDKKLTNIAVVDLLPGGFEVIRSSVERTAYNWRADYVDVREDRVVYYGDFDSSLRELTYKVKLTAAGSFVIPPSFAESMYDRSVRAVSKAGLFTVNKML